MMGKSAIEKDQAAMKGKGKQAGTHKLNMK